MPFRNAHAFQFLNVPNSLPLFTYNYFTVVRTGIILILMIIQILIQLYVIFNLQFAKLYIIFNIIVERHINT